MADPGNGGNGGEKGAEVNNGQAIAIQLLMEKVQGLQQQVNAQQASAQQQQQHPQQQINVQEGGEIHQQEEEEEEEEKEDEVILAGEGEGAAQGQPIDLVQQQRQLQQMEKKQEGMEAKLAVIIPMPDAIKQRLEVGNHPRDSQVRFGLNDGGAMGDDALVVPAASEAEKSTGQKETEKRDSREWIAKEGVRRWYAAMESTPAVTTSRLQEQVHDGLDVTDAAFKSIITLSDMEIKNFRPRQVQIGGNKPKSERIIINDRFAAFTHGLEAIVAPSTAHSLSPRAIAFLAQFQVLTKELHTYVSKYRAAFQGDFGDTLMTNLENAVDEDLEQVAAKAGEVADKLRQRFRFGPPEGTSQDYNIPNIAGLDFTYT
ncbi:unnamed protein product [Pylaiella littoralis]